MSDPVIHPEVTATNLLDQLNVSSEHDDVCRIALEAASSPVLWIAHWTQIVFSAACIVIIYDTARAKKKRAFHANFLIITGMFCTIEAMFDVFTIITTLVSQFRYWTLSDPCDLASSTVLVFSLRLPRHIHIVAISYLAVSGCIERAIAVMRVEIYEELHFSVGIVLAVAPCIFCAATVAYIVVDAGLAERAPFAPFNGSLFTASTSVIYTCLIMVNISATATNIFLWYINNQLFKRKTENYKLSKSYQMSENQVVMLAMIPGAIAHSVGFILVIAVRLLIATVRFEERNDSIVATEGGYTLSPICSFAALYAYRQALLGIPARPKVVRLSEEGSLYFKQLRDQLEGPLAQPTVGRKSRSAYALFTKRDRKVYGAAQTPRRSTSAFA